MLYRKLRLSAPACRVSPEIPWAQRVQDIDRLGFLFPERLVPNDKVPYLAVSGRRTNKNVVGRSERNKVHWHLATKVNIVLGPPA
jgi:hypothetical protein